MFSEITFMRSDWARMPEAATDIEVVKSMRTSPYMPVLPMAVFIMEIALA